MTCDAAQQLGLLFFRPPTTDRRFCPTFVHCALLDAP